MKRTCKTDYLYILPAVILVVVFFISSILVTVGLSFYEWDGFSDTVFVGLNNYKSLFEDQNFIRSLINTAIWVAFSLVISLVIPLLFAVLIVNSNIQIIAKNILYFPSTLSGTVASLVILSMLSTYGVPQIFGLLGKEEWVRDWLAVPYVNTFIMIFMGTWQGIGMSMLIFIAGLRNVDKSIIEAMQIDGGSILVTFRKVILPSIKPITIIVLLMSLVNSFKAFDTIWIMTKGGPYRTSETLALTMYMESFIRNNYGSGAAVAVILTILILIIAYFNIRNTFINS